MNDFQKECDNYVKQIAEELESLLNGNSDELDALQEQLDEIEEAEPEEPEQAEDESDEDYDKRYDAWETEWNEWEAKRDEKQKEVDNFEEKDLWSYFDDYLDVNYVVDYQRKYRSASICIGWGGPNVYIDTEDAMVKLYWGSTRSEAPFSYRVRDAIDEIFEEIYENAA